MGNPNNVQCETCDSYAANRDLFTAEEIVAIEAHLAANPTEPIPDLVEGDPAHDIDRVRDAALCRLRSEL